MCVGILGVRVVTSLQVAKFLSTHITILSYFPYHIKFYGPSGTNNDAFSPTSSSVPNEYR